MLAIIVFFAMLYVSKRNYEQGLREGYAAGLRETSTEYREEGYSAGLMDSEKEGIVINSKGMFMLGNRDAKVTQRI